MNIIESELSKYDFENAQEELWALREITQKVILHSLAKRGFFKQAVFHGGTSLRIFYNLPRYSEHLDFSLHHIDSSFDLLEFVNPVKEDLKVFGYEVDIVDKSTLENNVKKVFVKDNAIIRHLEFSHVNRRQKISVKVELDIHPPSGAVTQMLPMTFPSVDTVIVHDLPTIFSGKVAALLNREYTKGRDWFDIMWFAQRNVPMNEEYLKTNLKQDGNFPEDWDFSISWVCNKMIHLAEQLDIGFFQEDIIAFLKPSQRETVKQWTIETMVKTIAAYQEQL